MNGTASGPTGYEREELDRLLPDPARRRLPADRHQILRERLMHQIRESEAAPPRRTRRALLAPALLGAGLAVALGAGAVTTAVSGTDDRPPVVGQRDELTTLVDRIALAAQTRGQAAAPVRDDQYSYIETTTKAPYGTVRKQLWRSVNGAQAGLVRNEGAGRGPHDLTYPKNTKPSLSHPTYRFLAGLPADPDALLAMINEEVRRLNALAEDERKRAQVSEKGLRPEGLPSETATFLIISEIIRDPNVPPAVLAALYKAVAKVPGVSVVQDVVDANGRHGIGLSATSANRRTTWIFDRDTLLLSGVRDEVSRDRTTFRSADSVYVSAVVAYGIVDKVGETPK